MKKLVRVLGKVLPVMFAVTLLLSCSSSQPELEQWQNRKVPMTRVAFTDGEYRLLTPYDGKSRAIMFWASWCSSSKAEIERFEALAKKHQGISDVEFIAVSIDEQKDWSRVDGVIQSLSLWSIRHGFSGNGPADEAYLAYGFREVPVLLYISPRGDILQIGDSVSDLEIPLS